MEKLHALWAATVTRTIVTFILATLGGAAAQSLGIPAGWFAGSLFIVLIASLSGFRTETPKLIRTPAYMALGVMAGSGVTPATLHQMQTWPLSFVLLAVSIVLVVVASFWWLHRVSGWDRNSALLASLPGALSFVMSAAESLKTDNKRIAISQSMRVIILVEGIPLLSLMLGYDTSPVGAQAMVSATLAESALLIAVGVVGGFLLDRTGLPGGIMIGAVLSTGALYLTGVVDGYLPRDLMIPVVITLGAIAGTRLRPGDFGLVLKLAMPSFVAFAITVGITMSAAVTVSMLVGIDLLQVFLAFAPGAVDALLVIAFALDADPAYVVAHHVVRILLVAFTLPFVIRWISRHS